MASSLFIGGIILGAACDKTVTMCLPITSITHGAVSSTLVNDYGIAICCTDICLVQILSNLYLVIEKYASDVKRWFGLNFRLTLGDSYVDV
jgi:hypothetical protein